ncbi:MAG TPA: ElyC/SanA/YdcF family protein [Candidatus Paceibacterota bacterium]|nr:ElyC/SanA/YdcF family protein [Candidatus Paceibacterota bacterium]
MWLLLHGNGTPSSDGGVSPQFIDRAKVAIDRYWQRRNTIGEIQRICFFADDTYPSGESACEFFRKRANANGISDQNLVINPSAKNTEEEIASFAAMYGGAGAASGVCVVTSRYHIFRSRLYLQNAGYYFVESSLSETYDPMDVSFEPAKVAKAYGERFLRLFAA